MRGRELGRLTLARAVEMVVPFDRQTFIPETAPAEWAPHEGWLKPKAIDPATGALLFTSEASPRPISVVSDGRSTLSGMNQ